MIRLVRTAWRRLTSMRTALILLFLLAVAAVPGSLLPQRPLNPTATASYITAHGGFGRLLDTLGMFDVFGAPWFAAIYLLLFTSLVGCLIPRIRVHARALARKPLPAPRNLDRLPESARYQVPGDVDTAAAVARRALGRRWRVTRRVEPSGAVTLSAEKGYSRETGNLIFHVALLAALILIAVGRLYSYSGTRILVQGDGFCNQVALYDSWHPGRFAAEGKVGPAPFCITDLRKFTATYSAAGEPLSFTADVSYQRKLGAPVEATTLRVNHPLRLEGDRVYLIGHGYAPRVTVRMPNGTVRHDTEVFVPSNGTTLYSEGAYKLPGPTGAKQDIGLAGYFAPTPTLDANGLTVSASPQVHNPVLGLIVYKGDLNADGEQQSVYSLDHRKMKQLGRVDLHIGASKTFADGTKVTFDGWTPWASLQVSHDPSQTYLLLAALAMVVGLAGSLAVRRRRVWLRLTPAEPASGPGAGAGRASPTVVDVGGLARSDSGNFPAEFAALVERLRSAATPGDVDGRDVTGGSNSPGQDAEPQQAVGAGSGRE